MELTANPSSTTAARPANGRVADGAARADATGAGLTIRLGTDLRWASRAPGARPPRAPRGRAGVLLAVLGRRSRCRRRGGREREDGRHRRASGASGSSARIPDHRWRDPIQRSALAIKGLTYMPTGATVAALTTSLPETPGGERNWDYRYTWLRDTTFTLQALHYLNLDWEAEEFMQFVADLEPNADGALQIMYGIDGRRDLTESTRDELSGYAGARPGADRQRRLRPAPERRLRRGPRRGAAAQPPQPAPATALWPMVEAQAELRANAYGEARPGHLGGARQAPALRVLEDDVLGGDGPRLAAGGDPRRRRAAGNGHDRRRRSSEDILDQRRHRATACCASTTTPTRWTPHAAGGDLRVPAQRRRAPARDRDRDRQGAHRGRVRAALPHRRDRRRRSRQGGQLPDLLVLAGVRRWRSWASSSRPAT